MDDTSSPPLTERVRAIDIRPGRFGMWTSIEGGDTFVNELCLRRWSEDKTRIVFMFDSHNFLYADPQEFLEVVRLPERDFTFVDSQDVRYGFPLFPAPANRVRLYG